MRRLPQHVVDLVEVSRDLDDAALVPRRREHPVVVAVDGHGLEPDPGHGQGRSAEDALRDRPVVGDELRRRRRLQLARLRAALVPEARARTGPGTFTEAAAVVRVAGAR